MDFKAENFYRGTKFHIENGSMDVAKIKEEQVFWEVFQKWKTQQNLSDNQKEKYIVMLEKLIDGRVKTIISGQHRNHYESVAALAAALGEVKESVEKTPCKQMILQKYRK